MTRLEWWPARPRGALVAALLTWAALATPPLRATLEASMVLHMLVQLPLLVAAGALAAFALRGHAPRAQAPRLWDACLRGGAAGLLFAGFVLALWMLPRLLDGAVLEPRFEVAKFLLLPAAGAALVLSWPRCPPLGRLFVHIEAIAMLLRFGWGYADAPDRLCAVYLFDEQLRAGTALLVAGGVYALAAAWPALFGAAPWHLARRRRQPLPGASVRSA